MGKFGTKITLTQQGYNDLVEAKRLIGATSWDDFASKILALLKSGQRKRARVA